MTSNSDELVFFSSNNQFSDLDDEIYIFSFKYETNNFRCDFICSTVDMDREDITKLLTAIKKKEKFFNIFTCNDDHLYITVENGKVEFNLEKAKISLVLNSEQCIKAFTECRDWMRD